MIVAGLDCGAQFLPHGVRYTARSTTDESLIAVTWAAAGGELAWSGLIRP